MTRRIRRSLFLMLVAVLLAAAPGASPARAQELDQVVAGLESGRGTAGQLLHDRQLYENMNRAVLEVRELIGEVRKDPRKYLRVKLSLF